LIALGGLSLIEANGLRGINAQAATCEFDAGGDSYLFSTQKLAGSVSDEIFRKWQAQGIPDFVALAPNPGVRRVRFVVLDVPTGLTGALDIPVRPEDLEIAAPIPAAPPAVAVTAVLAIPDRDTPEQAWRPHSTGALTFSVPSGQSGTLDWNGDALFYRGDMAFDQSAAAFFNYAFGARFHCQAGRLVAMDPAGSEPRLRVVMGNPEGKIATVDMKGEQPQYLGDLPIDSSARAFFERVWRLTRCQAP
jgi:hypothetical protein